MDGSNDQVGQGVGVVGIDGLRVDREPGEFPGAGDDGFDESAARRTVKGGGLQLLLGLGELGLHGLGLGDLADRRPAQVSGGQAQRVTIARALVANPGVVFADEPTGALDQSTGHEVMQMLTTIVRQAGASLVMVTHDPKVADWMQRRVEIRDGIIHDDRRLGVIR